MTAEKASTAVHNHLRMANWLQRGLFGLGIISGAVAGANASSDAKFITAMAEVPVAVGVAVADNKLAIRACERTLREYRQTLAIQDPSGSHQFDRFTNQLGIADIATPLLIAPVGAALGAIEYTTSHPRDVVGVYTFSGVLLTATTVLLAAANMQNNRLASHYDYAIATLANANASNVTPLRPHQPPQA